MTTRVALRAAARGRTFLGRSTRGLYHGKSVLYGHSVSFSQRKTNRIWKPNVHSKEYFSQVLGRPLRFTVTTNVMRTIEKHGGIDGYLCKTKDSKLGNPIAIHFKRRIKSVMQDQQRGLASGIQAATQQPGVVHRAL